MNDTHFINVYRRANRRYTCEFSVSVSYIAKGGTRYSLGAKNFKSPLKAQEYINRLVELGNHAIYLAAASSMKELIQHVAIWSESK